MRLYVPICTHENLQGGSAPQLVATKTFRGPRPQLGATRTFRGPRPQLGATKHADPVRPSGLRPAVRARFCATVALNGSVSAVGTHTGAAPWQPLDSMGAVENDPPFVCRSWLGHGCWWRGSRPSPRARPSAGRAGVLVLRRRGSQLGRCRRWEHCLGGGRRGGGGPQHIFLRNFELAAYLLSLR